MRSPRLYGKLAEEIVFARIKNCFVRDRVILLAKKDFFGPQRFLLCKVRGTSSKVPRASTKSKSVPVKQETCKMKPNNRENHKNVAKQQATAFRSLGNRFLDTLHSIQDHSLAFHNQFYCATNDFFVFIVARYFEKLRQTDC